MSVKINLGAWNSVFVVPTKVIDEGLKFADGAKLKVLLFVLRNSDKELTEEMISKATGVNVTEVIEALDYWVSFDILSKKENDYHIPESKENFCVDEEKFSLQNNSLNNESALKNSASVDLSDTTTIGNSQNDNESKSSFNTLINNEESKKSENNGGLKKQTNFVSVTRLQKPDYVFTAQRLAVDEELGFLVNEVQTVLGKTLSNSDISTLLMLKDTCGLPLDVILMLVNYCLSINKGNMRTIEKIGISWADDGIDCVEAADNKIRRIKQSSMNFSTVSSAFGMTNIGSPTKKQLEYSDKWVGEWRFSSDMLREAYERCVDTKSTLNFRYIDGILKRWYSNSIKNLNDLQSFEKSASKTSDKRKASYDIDELDKIDTLDDV